MLKPDFILFALRFLNRSSNVSTAHQNFSQFIEYNCSSSNIAVLENRVPVVWKPGEAFSGFCEAC